MIVIFRLGDERFVTRGNLNSLSLQLKRLGASLARYEQSGEETFGRNDELIVLPERLNECHRATSKAEILSNTEV